MPGTISRGWSFQGFEVVRLENDTMVADVVPKLGGRIVHLFHKGMARQFLWHNPRLKQRELPIGSKYDDHFFGGWEELLPNDLAEDIGGEPWADHGELWTCPLDATNDDNSLLLRGTMPINPLAYERRMRLDDAEPILRMESTVTNVGREPIDFLWKLHPALKVSQGCEIVVPAGNAIPVDPSFSRFGHVKEFPWPDAAHAAGAAVRADRIGPMDGTTEFLYLTELESGTCGLANKAEDWRFTVDFPVDVFPTVWIFASYGGWRDLEVLILEPCTTWPKALSEAIDRGRARHLVPGESVTADIAVTLGRYDRSEA